MRLSTDRLARCFLGLVLLVGLSACHKDTASGGAPTSPAKPTATSEKRYHLEGKVVSTNKQSKMVNVDSQAIPGFMDAMTMSYAVKPESELDRLSPGDHITADVVAGDDGMWLEKIAVTSPAGTPASK